MTTATAEEPIAGYDKLKTKDLIASLSSHSQNELASVKTTSGPTRLARQSSTSSAGCVRRNLCLATTLSAAARW